MKKGGTHDLEDRSIPSQPHGIDFITTSSRRVMDSAPTRKRRHGTSKKSKPGKVHRINWNELFYGTLGNGEVLGMRRPSTTKGAILTRTPTPVVAFIKSRNRLAIPPGRCAVFKNLRETGRVQPGQPIITGYGSSKRTTTIHDHLGTDPYVTKRKQAPSETFQTQWSYRETTKWD
jgi:hypothetical protein